MITADDVEHAAFGRAQEGKSGYEEATVDTFLDRVVETLKAIEQGKPLPADALKSTDVVEAVFGEKGEHTSGGYDLDDVDDLLDRVAQRLFEHEKLSASTQQQAAHEPAGDEPGDLVDNEPRQEDQRGGGPVVVARDGHPLDQRESVGGDRGVSVATDEAVRDEARPATDAVVARDERDAAKANARDTTGVAAEPLVEQYPATEHRVPLPRGDVNGSLTDEDRRAQENYHPEYSEYDATAAANRPVAETPADASATAASVDSESAQAPVPAATTDKTGTQTFTDTAAERPAVTEPAVQPQPEPLPSGTSTGTSVGRPEGIGRPEPIDRPRETPKREEKTRKGLLRRLFRG